MATDLAPVTPSVLKWARESLGASLEEAAKRAGMTVERVSAWEAGEAEPTVAKLRELAKLYQRPLSIFFLPEPPIDYDTLRDFRRLPGQPDHWGFLGPAGGTHLCPAKTGKGSAGQPGATGGGTEGGESDP